MHTTSAPKLEALLKIFEKPYSDDHRYSTLSGSKKAINTDLKRALGWLHPRRPRGSQSDREKRQDESFQVRAKDPLGTDSHRTISKNSSRCRPLIGHKKCFVLLCPIGEQFLLSSFLEFVHDCYGLSITACLAHALKKCTQSGNFQFDIKAPSDFKILSAGKIKTLFQKYKLELATGIHACIGHASCVNTREFSKDTTTADSHENVAWKSEFTFFQSLSWLFQLAYFVKCKRTLLELNFY